MRKVEEKFKVVVVGGGVAGVVAAVAAARHGCPTCLLHDRPVLGGNASSEIRVGIEGADFEFRHARETGILEELRTEDRKRNFHRSINGATNYIFDTILLEWVKREKNLTLHLNTSVFKARVKNGMLESVEGLQSGNETLYRISGDVFIDASGDGVVAAESGAEYRMGRESRREFGESLAPEHPDDCTMGSSLLFHVVDRGRLVKFEPPDWAYDFPLDEDLWEHNYGWGFHGPYVWVEYGGDGPNTITDNEKITEELLKVLYGVWDHIKNHGNHHAENLEIDWVGSIPGKRESRRITGDYLLVQGDIEERRLFKDRVAYGGYPMDMHHPGGFGAKLKGVSMSHVKVLPAPGLFSLPFRCFYSRNVHNLMMAGRNISVSHAALSGVRVIATCAVGGQATGTAAAFCIRHKTRPRAVGKLYMRELQQTLLKDDCYMIGVKNNDRGDIALRAAASASSSRKLEVVDGKETFQLNVPRAQRIAVSGRLLKTVWLRLRNRSGSSKKICLKVIRASFLEDRISGESCVRNFGRLSEVEIVSAGGGFKHDTALATADGLIPPCDDKWVRFQLNAELPPGTYWIILPESKDVFCFGSGEIVPGITAAYEVPPRGWFLMRNHIFQFKLGPCSFPFGAENVNNGISRPEDLPNIWISEPGMELPQHVSLKFRGKKIFNTIHLTFDTNLDRFQTAAPYPETVSDYEIMVKYRTGWRSIVRVKNNCARKRIHSFGRVCSDSVKLVVQRTNGTDTARVYEIRVYNERSGL